MRQQPPADLSADLDGCQRILFVPPVRFHLKAAVLSRNLLCGLENTVEIAPRLESDAHGMDSENLFKPRDDRFRFFFVEALHEITAAVTVQLMADSPQRLLDIHRKNTLEKTSVFSFQK